MEPICFYFDKLHTFSSIEKLNLHTFPKYHAKFEKKCSNSCIGHKIVPKLSTITCTKNSCDDENSKLYQFQLCPIKFNPWSNYSPNTIREAFIRKKRKYIGLLPILGYPPRISNFCFFPRLFSFFF